MATINQPQRITIREQIKQKTDSILEDTSWNKLPRITIYDKQYIANVWLQTTTNSSILEHGDYLIPIETEVKHGVHREKKGIKIWLCHHCDKLGRIKIFNGASTNGAKAHLETKGRSGHGLVVGKRGYNSIVSGSQASPFGRDVLQQVQEQGLQGKAEIYKAMLLKLIIMHDIQLDTLTKEAFKTLACYFSGGLLEGFLPDSVSTVQSWLLEAFQEGRAIVKEQLRGEARSKIHLSFDTSLSPYKNKGVLAVVAHFVDKDWKPRARLIGLKKVEGAYSPENIACSLIDVIEEYGIYEKLGFYVANHHTRNDQVLCLLLRHYNSDLTEKDAMKLVDQIHVRSCDHVLNTTATNFVYKIKDNEKHRSIAIASIENGYRMNTFIRGTLERRNDFRQEAMKTESVRKLVKEGNVRELDEFLDEDEEIDTIDPDTEGDEWFNSSSSRGIWDIGEGKIEVHNSNVAKIEGDTCWNGVLKGVQSTLTFKEAIISFTDRYDSEKGQTKGRINLSEKICLQDWECLGEVGTILKTIDDCTIPYMDNVVDLPMVMSLLYWLRGHFLEYYSVFSISDSTLDSETDPEDCYSIPTSQAASQQSLHTPTQRGMKRKKSIDGPHEEVAVDIDTRQKKKTSAERKNDVGEQGRDDIHDGLRRVNNVLQEYWDMFNGMPAYWAAVVLDPSKRLKKLQIKGPQLAKEIKEKVLAYWRSHYADPATLTKSNAEAVTSSSQLHSPKKFAWLSHYDSPDSDSEDEDELEYYLNMEKTGFKRGQEPLLWWRDHQTEFPRLHQFALDILSIPSTSMKCKRILKQSESAMFESRRTEYNMLEITQCLKSWLEEVEE